MFKVLLSLLSCVLEIFIIESLIEEERSGRCVEAVEGERVEATIFKETRLLLTLARGACVGQGGDQEEANLEMLNVQKG